MQKKLIEEFENKIKDMGKQELKELLLINTYKLALVRAQLDAVTTLLIKNNLTTYEDIWKKTNEIFQDSTV